MVSKEEADVVAAGAKHGDNPAFERLGVGGYTAGSGAWRGMGRGAFFASDGRGII